MKENFYDNQPFFDKYSAMARSQKGLEGAGEWPTLKTMLPDFKNKVVLDLGCGYGWHCMYAIQNGEKSVLGIDLSRKMIKAALERNNSDNIRYKVLAVEDYDYPCETYDIIISSLTLHYVENLTQIFALIYKTLKKNGVFVFTIEHPIFTALGTQEWIYDKNHNPIYWPVDNYFSEGKRVANFLNESVVKYHHTITSVFQSLLKNNFIIKDVIEPQPTAEMVNTIPGMNDELRRPMMLAVSVTK